MVAASPRSSSVVGLRLAMIRLASETVPRTSSRIRSRSLRPLSASDGPVGLRPRLHELLDILAAIEQRRVRQ